MAKITEIAGFTKWSSDRSPGEVFQLLEKLYNAFDELAEQQEVFKIETIGDRYVAVTGIPSAQSDHALLLTNFANDLLKRFSKELEIVAPVLGFETLNLSMRIGIHSGPVISGVIRGAKTRFQLFGDSIHTGKIERMSILYS